MTTEAKFLKDFGARIAELRRKRKLTQEELADQVDLHRERKGRSF